MTIPQAPDALRPADANTQLNEPERLDAEMRYLLYILSHDLRGPFITLRGFVDELRMIADDIRTSLDAVMPTLDSCLSNPLEVVQASFANAGAWEQEVENGMRTMFSTAEAVAKIPSLNTTPVEQLLA